MKRLLVLIFIAASFNYSSAQTEQQPPAQQKAPTVQQIFSNHYSRTYQAAIRYNDYAMAKNALYNLLVENPQNDSILFSLSVLYFQNQQYASAAITANDVIAMNPNNTGALEVSAKSLENLGALDKALESYETLYLKTDDYETLYQIAFLQYQLKRYGESLTNADILLGKKQADELTVNYQVSEQEQKDFPIKVALLNLKGLISEGQGDNAKAKSFYNEALKLAPDFPLAKANLERINK